MIVYPVVKVKGGVLVLAIFIAADITPRQVSG
jgi:hypothetical protein